MKMTVSAPGEPDYEIELKSIPDDQLSPEVLAARASWRQCLADLRADVERVRRQQNFGFWHPREKGLLGLFSK